MRNIRTYVEHLNEEIKIRNWRNKILVDLEQETLQGMDLRSYNLYNANLWKLNLSGCNMSGMDLRSCYVALTNFTGADLSGSDLSDSHGFLEAKLEKANLNDTKLHGISELETSKCLGTTFVGASVSETKIYGTKESPANFDGTIFNNVKFSGNFEGSNFSGSSFSNCKILNEYNFNNCDLSRTKFDEDTMKDLFDARIYNPSIFKPKSPIKGSNLEGSNILQFLESYVNEKGDKAYERVFLFLDECTGISRKLQRIMGMSGMFSKNK